MQATTVLVEGESDRVVVETLALRLGHDLTAEQVRIVRILQRQPSQRERPVTAQLRRFFGGLSGNKARYARLLVEALPAGHAPPPLARLVASFSPAGPPRY